MKRPAELSRAAFRAALRRNGFRIVLLWCEDISGATPGHSYGMVMNTKGKILRRATLAHVIRERDKVIAGKVAA